MDPVDLTCLDGKHVFLSKPRTLVNLDESLIVEIDVVVTTLVFRRKDAIEYRGAYRDTYHGDRVHRARYEHDVPADVLSVATQRALDACALHDVEPPTERRGAS